MQSSPARLATVWVALLVLLGLSAASTRLQLGPWNSVVNLAIATAKAALVALYFMHLARHAVLARMVAVTGIGTLALLLGLSASDYATRRMYRAPWGVPAASHTQAPRPPPSRNSFAAAWSHPCPESAKMNHQTTREIPHALAPASLSRSFVFCTGIENSAPVITGPDGKPCRIDQMEESGHYQRWREDFQLVRDLGIRCLRYGPPYYRTHVGPGQYDWSFADDTFNALRELGIVPIADLCHFGLPDWLGNFQNADFPRYFAEYAGEFARRYPWIRLVTPVNEMLVTAEYSARLGYWNERRADDRSFVTALGNVVEANIRASEALRAVSDPWFVQSESARYFHPRNPDAVKFTKHMNERRFLTLDLNYSHAPSATMYEYLIQNGMSPDRFHYFMNRDIWRSCIMGMDYYEQNEMIVFPDASVRICNVLGYYGLTRQYYSRFRLPIMHTETNQMEERDASHWLERQWANVLRLRQEGYPIIGFTWYSLTDQVDWDIGLREKRGHVNANGLYNMERKIRPAGKEFGRIIREWKDVLANTEIRF